MNSQRPDNLPPFFHELTNDEVFLLTAAETMRGMIDLVYRERGISRMDAAGKDTHIGRMGELHHWLSQVQQLGERLAKRQFHSLEPTSEPSTEAPTQDAGEAPVQDHPKADGERTTAQETRTDADQA